MKQLQFTLWAITTVLAVSLAGCLPRDPDVSWGVDRAIYRDLRTKIEYTDALAETVEIPVDTVVDEGVVWTRWDAAPTDYHDVTLENVMQIALSNAEVIRTMGGEVRATDNQSTLLDPAIQATDPRFGIEAALVPFDVVFSSNVNAENNDRQINNQFAGGGSRTVTQDLMNWNTGLTKRTASGTEFSLRHIIEYDTNVSPGNQFPSSWTEFMRLEARHPLLRGSGALYNRVAGPDGAPGVYNGVMIARNSVDVVLMDLEANLRDYVSDVESLYWELAFAYRRLDALTQARDKSYETWQDIRARQRHGSRGSEASREAQARSQYYDLESQVTTAERGAEGDLTRTSPGVHAGEFRGVGSVRANERALRQLIGMPVTDTRPLRPIDEPIVARIQFDIQSMQNELLYRRVELRRQQILVRNREMQLWASRQLLKPRLDLVAGHTFRGFGDDLSSNDDGRFSGATQNLLSGEFQESLFGLQYEVALGNRRENAAIEQSQLMLTRDKIRLEDRERQYTTELVASVERVDAAYDIIQSQKLARDAAWEELNVVQLAYNEGEITEIDQVLVAQRKFAERDMGYFKAVMDYVLAVKNVHYQKGSLLEYNHVVLADAGEMLACYTNTRRRLPGTDRLLNYVMRDRADATPRIATAVSPLPDALSKPADSSKNVTQTPAIVPIEPPAPAPAVAPPTEPTQPVITPSRPSPSDVQPASAYSSDYVP